MRNLLATIGLAVLLAGCTSPATPAPTLIQTSTALPQPAATTAPVVSLTATPSALPTETADLSSAIEFRNPRHYSVDYVATVYNDGFGLSKLDFFQPMPVDWDGQQHVQVETVTPEKFSQSLDPVFGNGIYYWRILGAPKAGESLQFSMRFTFDAFEISTRVAPDTVPSYNQDDPLYELYTRPEEFIESADPRIVKLADSVAAGETNPYRLARKFYDYVIDTAHYQLLGQGLRGATALLTTGEGECGDYSALFVALSRARGIPARPVVGYWAISGLEQTHVWAEFYIEGLGWIPVDPTIGQRSESERAYYFGNMDNQRVILNKGFNIQLPGGRSAAFLQTPFWWFWGDGDANTMKMERTTWTVAEIP